MSKTDTIKKRKVKKKLDPNKYANIETAETFDSELNPGETPYMDVETGEYVLSFANFVSSDAVFDEKICWLLSAADYRRYRLMSNWLHTNFNVILSGNNRPHTLQTLAKAIRLSVDETTRLVKRLAAKGLLVYMCCPESGYDKKIFMMNPYVTRKRNSFHEHFLPLFTDIRHGKQKAKASKKITSKTIAQIQPDQAN